MLIAPNKSVPRKTRLCHEQPPSPAGRFVEGNAPLPATLRPGARLREDLGEASPDAPRCPRRGVYVVTLPTPSHSWGWASAGSSAKYPGSSSVGVSR